MDQVKLCPVCKESLPLNRFFVDNSRKDGYQYRCKTCRKPCAQVTYDKRKSKQLEEQRLYHKLNPKRRLLQAARRRAKAENLPYDLVYEDVIVPEFCPVLGIKLKNGEGKICDESPTIDKMIPRLGYVKSNIRVISFKANRYKSDMSLENVENLLRYMKS